jgi:hypothetical protein
LFDDVSGYEKAKNIIKELIFSGAKRDLTNDNGKTPLDIVEALITHLDEDDYKKLVYILTPPTGVRYCRMTRPIEKVKRSQRC